MTEKRNLLTQSRDYYKPFVYPWAYEAFMQSEQMHWLWTEVPMVEDVKDWKMRLNDNERDFLTKVFRFFTQGDIDVSSAYVHTYLPAFPQPEIRMMLSSFAAREAVHIAAYSHLIETIGMPDAIYNEFLQYEAMAAKHEFFHGLRLNQNESIAAKMAAFSAFTEGMQLFSSFVMLLNFTRNGTMRGMGQIIAWSINDETLHTESMIKLFREYIEQNPQLWNDDLKSTIYSIAEKMVELEDRFIDLAFGVNQMQKLAKEDVKKYIRFIADRRLSAMGMKSFPSAVSSICLNPLLRTISGKFSSFSSAFSRWLMVGWERNRASAVLEMLLVWTMVKNISTSVRSITRLLSLHIFYSIPENSAVFNNLRKAAAPADHH